MGSVLLSPQQFPMNILLLLPCALDVGREEAEAFIFWEQVTALLVIWSIRYSGQQQLIELLLVRVRDVRALPK